MDDIWASMPDAADGAGSKQLSDEQAEPEEEEEEEEEPLPKTRSKKRRRKD